MGASCLNEETDKARQECEDVCAIEAKCELRDEDECLKALCTEDGFRTIKDGDNTVDLQKVDANECMREAENCADAVLCACPDGCARVGDCTGTEEPTCEDTCHTLMEQAANETYLEIRCQLESTCADLPACGGVSET
jgi:hypothetical protein